MSDAYGWLSKASRYTHNGEAGVIGDRDEEFERETYVSYTGAGSHFHTMLGIVAQVEGPHKVNPIITVSLLEVYSLHIILTATVLWRNFSSSHSRYCDPLDEVRNSHACPSLLHSCN